MKEKGGVYGHHVLWKVKVLIEFENFKTRKNIISNRIERPAKKSLCLIQKECEVWLLAFEWRTKAQNRCQNNRHAHS